MIDLGPPPKLLAKPALILPRPAEIVRPGDPRFIVPAMFALTGLSGFGAGQSGPSGTWTQTWSKTMSTDQSPFVDYSFRAVLAAADISLSGSYCRVTISSNTGGALSLDNVSIMEQSSGATGTGSIGQFTFSSSASVTVPSNSTSVSDLLAFAIDETKSYLVTMDVSSSNGNLRYASSGDTYFQSAFNGYNTTSGTGYSLSAGALYMVSKLEVLI